MRNRPKMYRSFNSISVWGQDVVILYNARWRLGILYTRQASHFSNKQRIWETDIELKLRYIFETDPEIKQNTNTSVEVSSKINFARKCWWVSPESWCEGSLIRRNLGEILPLRLGSSSNLNNPISGFRHHFQELTII